MARFFLFSRILLDFGSLLVFWVLASFYSVRIAIAGTFVFILCDGLHRYLGKRTFPRLWIISNTLAIVFGVIDLISITPFMIRYEGVLTNLIIALSFAVGAFGATTPIQELVEEQQGFPFPPERQEIRAYFKSLTLVWALYFAAKAILYFWLLTYFPLPRALMLRSVIGTVSLGVMIGISLQGRRIFLLCQRAGFFLPRYSTEPQA
ncbi:septation protein IspZ [Acetobacter senegalensis]|uniref:septation protein IspZ n=1 Tax=Acetobacter senegalensis TaxID=446692 RepID=UPI001EDA5B00|nr:septation protein IspZ [Acetobacter senegalensis]MCG4259540.1 septation protein IspZ [Acetobacter senegalensis]MCP1196888.1 septation protein IspZ [Acetobacter senegalensis]